ncbi:MAG: biotin--[acetyl-CoA-carboxylase] ligase family protein [Bdellovibrionaceae bacterium]|nr:biotin--[acetyl-CoA-carboxylase] ligase family protein [Pseudobdellovibrionaceae bacterium]
MKDTPFENLKIGEITHQWARSNGIKSVYASSMDSTNNRAKELAFDKEMLEQDFFLVLADHQSRGRGRGQNRWESSPGAALLSSWVFSISAPPRPTFSPRLGLALYRSASSTWPTLDFALKAPNDLLLGTRKVAGLLVEVVSQGDEHRLIVGLGLNVFTSPELPSATSLLESMPEGVPLLGADWVHFLERWLFELTLILPAASEELDPNLRAGLRLALNKNSLLSDPYTLIEADGTLVTEKSRIHWSNL